MDTLQCLSDSVDVTSWVSVCPRGLWKVQKKKPLEEHQLTVPKAGPVTCMLLLNYQSLVYMFRIKMCNLSYIMFSSFLACSAGYSPRLGSLCQVRVRVKANMEDTDSSASDEGNEKPIQPDQAASDVTKPTITAFPRCQESVLQVPLGDWTMLRLGEGQCDITEACLEGMRAGEKCEVRLRRVCRNDPEIYIY